MNIRQWAMPGVRHGRKPRVRLAVLAHEHKGVLSIPPVNARAPPNFGPQEVEAGVGMRTELGSPILRPLLVNMSGAMLEWDCCGEQDNVPKQAKIMHQPGRPLKC